MREAHVSIGDPEFEAMGIDGLVALCRDAGILSFEELVCRGTGAVVQVDVETPLNEDGLDALDCVDDWERVGGSTGDGGHCYVVAFTAPDLPESLADRMDDLVGTCDPEMEERGATLSLTGSQTDISDAVAEYESAGVSPDLRKLGPYEGGDRAMAELTDRQREVVRTAYDAGYYEVPREASTADVADEMGVDPSTVAEHLQRAERNLLRYHL